MFEKPLEILDICCQNVAGWMIFRNTLQVIFRQFEFHLRYYITFTGFIPSPFTSNMSSSKAFKVARCLITLLKGLR